MLKKVGKWFLAILVTLMLVSIPVGYVAGKIYYGNHKAHAEVQAKQYAGEMQYALKGVSCTNLDTDGDNYVSCTMNLQNGTVQRVVCVGNVPPWPIGPFIPNKGCKMKLQGNITSE